MYFRLANLVVASSLLAAQAAAAAPATVQVELFGDGRSAGMTFQQWAEALDRAGIAGARIRAADGSEAVGIEDVGTGGNRHYIVRGQVLSHDEVAMPGGRYRRTELARLKIWLEDLKTQGPPGERPARGAFGLTAAEFRVVHAALSPPVGFDTTGMGRGQVVARIAGGLGLPLPVDAALVKRLDEDKVADDLSNVARGTALACLLREAGYGLLPRVAARPELTPVAMKPGVQVWPVGWPPEDDTKPLPEIHEFLNVNIQNVSAADAMKAIAGRLHVPALVDHAAMRRFELAPSQTGVSLPAGRTTYSLALRKVLGQAKMKFEVRLDEADKPFLWVTSMKPMSFPAERGESKAMTSQ